MNAPSTTSRRYYLDWLRVLAMLGVFLFHATAPFADIGFNIENAEQSTAIMLFHGFMVGLLFGSEFVCIYLGLLYTDAARAIIFVYLSPFVVALGAHFFLKGDRLTPLKTAGLVLAFAGVVTVFYGRPKTAPKSMLLGDSLQIAGAILWGATTLYIKKYMAEKVHPVNTFLYQLVFSIPVLFAMS